MTTISNTFTEPHMRAAQHINRSIWRDIGFGLAVVVTALAMTALGTQGRSGLQTDRSWPVVEGQTPSRGWDNSVRPEAFPLGALPADVSR
jgi:hypothetical protein